MPFKTLIIFQTQAKQKFTLIDVRGRREVEMTGHLLPDAINGIYSHAVAKNDYVYLHSFIENVRSDLFECCSASP